MKIHRRHFSIALAVFGVWGLLLTCVAPTLSQTEPLTLFGPKQYDKPKGRPVTYTDTFRALSPEGVYHLWVQSGADGLNRVKNVSVSVNGVEVLDSGDLRAANPAVKAIDLQKENTIAVTLKGQGGNFITAKVFCEGCSPIQIIYPEEGATISSPYTSIKGEIINPSGGEMGVVVNGVVAQVSGHEFVANHVPLAEGWNTITAALNDIDGTRAETSVQVYGEPASQYVKLAPSLESGIAPLEMTFDVETSLSNPVSSSNLVCTGPSTPAITQTSQTEYAAAFSAEGLYDCTVSVADSQAQAFQDSISINVLSKTALNSLLQEKWSAMQAGLAGKNINYALKFFMEGSQQHYQKLFTALFDHLPQVAEELKDINLISIEENGAKYRIVKNEGYGGKLLPITYHIYFTVDKDGLWKIEKF